MGASPFTLPEPPTCYFCEVLSSPGHPAIVESGELLAVLVNARQHQEGQVLVVSRRHAPTLLDLDEDEARAVLCAAKRVAAALARAFDLDGLLVYQNNGVASGQEVPHFHLHVVPQRFAASRWGNEPPHVADALGRDFRPHEPDWLDEEALARVARAIRQCVEPVDGERPGTVV